MSTQCVNLRERFGSQFKVSHDPAYYAEHGAHGWADDPWLQIIPGRRGHVYPFGGEKLAAWSDTRGPTVKRLLELPGIEVIQDGSDGVTVIFRPDLLEQVADLLLLKRRRRVTEQERARLAAIGAATRIRPGTGAHGEARPCVPRGRQVSTDVQGRRRGNASVPTQRSGAPSKGR